MITEYVSSLLNPQASYRAWDDFWYNPPDGPTLSGPNVGPQSALHVSAYFNGVRILCESVAQPPLILYERMGEDEKEIARDAPLYNVLHNRPNAYQSSYEFRLLMTQNQILGGNAYAEILGGGRSAVEELRILMPGYMTVKKLASGRIGYMYRDEKGGQKPYTQDEIFHVRGFPLSPDGITGMGNISYARETIGLSLATEAYGSRLFKTDAKERGNYSVPGSLSKEQVTALREMIQQSEGLMILQNGATWVSTGMTARDAEFLLTRKFEVIEVARWLNIPPHMLKDLERATFSNIEHQAIEFLQLTMMPYFVNWEQAIHRDLIVQKNRFFAEFLVDGLVRADIKTRYDAYGLAIDKGFMTRNQARQKENWNRIEGLDAPLIDQNKAVVDKNGNIVPVNKPERPAPIEPAGDPRREREAAHYRLLLHGTAERVMRKEANSLARAWEKDGKDPEKLSAWAGNFFADHAEFLADVMQLDEETARRFANDRRDRFLLSIKDASVRDHIHHTGKYGPEQLVTFMQEAA